MYSTTIGRMECLGKTANAAMTGSTSAAGWLGKKRTPPGFFITSGVSFTYVMEARRELNFLGSVLKIGIDHPLPRKKILEFVQNSKFQNFIILLIIINGITMGLETSKAVVDELVAKTKSTASF